VTVDLLWAAAVEASLAEQDGYLDTLAAFPREDRPPIEAARAQLAEIRARWEPRFDALRTVRHAHALALVAYQRYVDGAGDFDALLEALDHVLGLYEELNGEP